MKKYISILAVAAALLSACGKDGNDTAPAISEISLECSAIGDGQILSGPDGGEYQVKVISSGEWRVSGLCDWVKASPVSGKSGATVTFTVDPNTVADEKTATFKIFSGEAVKSLTFVSAPAYVLSLKSEDAVSVGSDATSISVKLQSNVKDFDIDYGEAADWVSLDDISEAFGNKVLRFNIARSQAFKARTGILTINGTGVDTPAEVTITQAQRDTAFLVGEPRIIKGLEAFDTTLVIKSNVDATYSLPSWITYEDPAWESDLNTGLQEKHINIHADACSGSRAATVSLKKGSTVYSSFYIKQQNPNPVFANIPDANLRSFLEDEGWIIADNTGKCEIVEDGLTGKKLVIGSTSTGSYSTTTLDSIEGLEAFPALEELTLGSLSVKKVDVSAFPSIKALTMINLRFVEEVNTGLRPITDIVNKSGSYTYTNVPNITIKGDYIENVTFSSTSYYIGYGYETELESFDVTGCPALKTLNVNRKASSSYYSGQSSLKYIYMTAAQKESVTVTKQDSVEIVVK